MRPRYFKFPGKYVYKGWWHLAAIICDVFGRTEIYGYENVPDRPCIIVANHVSYLDPMAAGFLHETELCAVARDTLMDGWISGPFFRRLNAIPVKRNSANNLQAFREVLARVRDGHGVIIFPEGTRSPDGSLLPGKPGAGLLAIKAGVPILPMRTFGFNEVLPRSNKLGGGVRIVICVGAPMRPEDIDPGKGVRDREQVIVNRIMERIASIEMPKIRSY